MQPSVWSDESSSTSFSRSSAMLPSKISISSTAFARVTFLTSLESGTQKADVAKMYGDLHKKLPYTMYSKRNLSSELPLSWGFILLRLVYLPRARGNGE